MDVTTLEQFAADGLTGATFEKHIIRNDDGCAAVHLEKARHVLHEIELFIAGGGPEVVAEDGERLAAFNAFVIDNRDVDFLRKGGLVSTMS